MCFKFCAWFLINLPIRIDSIKLHLTLSVKCALNWLLRYNRALLNFERHRKINDWNIYHLYEIAEGVSVLSKQSWKFDKRSWQCAGIHFKIYACLLFFRIHISQIAMKALCIGKTICFDCWHEFVRWWVLPSTQCFIFSFFAAFVKVLCSCVVYCVIGFRIAIRRMNSIFRLIKNQTHTHHVQSTISLRRYK